MESGEFALLPEPLSVRIQTLPSFITWMPEWPCRGWPEIGRLMPVSRSFDLPMTDAGFSTRLRVVYLPADLRSSGALSGAAIVLLAGKMACPSRAEETSVCASAMLLAVARPSASASVEIRYRNVMECFLHEVGKPQEYRSSMTGVCK